MILNDVFSENPYESYWDKHLNTRSLECDRSLYGNLF